MAELLQGCAEATKEMLCSKISVGLYKFTYQNKHCGKGCLFPLNSVLTGM